MPTTAQQFARDVVELLEDAGVLDPSRMALAARLDAQLRELCTETLEAAVNAALGAQAVADLVARRA